MTRSDGEASAGRGHAGRPAPGAWQLRALVPSLVFVLGIVATIVTVVVIQHLRRSEGFAEFRSDVAGARELIIRRMAVHTALLEGAAGFFAAHENVTRAEFRAFVERLGIAERYPGVRGIGFSLRYAASEKEAVIARMRTQGNPDFAPWPSTPRDEYHSILFLEPLDERNRAAIGYDMFQELTRRLAMAAARDQGTSVASGRVELVQEIAGPKQSGFLLYMPVYRGGAIPTSVDQRRARLRGFVYSPFRADDLLRGVLGPDPHIDIEVFDGTDALPSARMHSSVAVRGEDSDSIAAARFATTELVDIAHRMWSIRFASREAQSPESIGLLPMLLGAAGSLVSAFLAWLTFLQVRARDAAEESAHLLFVERERFRTTLGSVGEAVVATDTAGLVTFMNAVAERLTGWQAEEAVGRPATEVVRLVDEASGEPLGSPVTRLRGGAEVRSTTNSTRLICRSGEVRPIDESVASIVDERGGLIGTVAAFRDTTERRLAEEELRIGEARKRTILESSLDSVITMDRSGRIVEFNSSAERTFGYRREEVVGRTVAETIIPPRFRTAHEVALRRFFRSRSAAARGRRISLTAMRSNGSELPVEAAIAVSFLDDGSLLCSAYLRDISAERRARIERERLLESERTARADAERASRLKDEFVATLSHELRTPLNAMLGWTHLLRRRQQEPAAVTEAIEVIERNARAQVRMVEDLLDMTRILAGKVRIDVQSCDPRAIIGAAVSSIEPAAQARNLSVTVEIDPQITTLIADPTRLQQIVTNLLSNAVKFTPERGAVRVECRREGECDVIRVIDTGVGIAADFLPYVFDRFRQADASTTRRFAGLGLGLSIVRQLVELHGGRVRAESEGPGRGSTFTVELPAAPTLPLVTGPRLEDVDEEPDSLSLKGVRVIVVDDEPDARELARVVLSDEGAVVEVASTAGEALAILARSGPCLLVSDIGMPGRDGYDLIRAVRSLPRDRGGDTPAAALTAFARVEDRRRALAAGYQLHATKPVEPLELVALVASLGRVARSAI